MAKFEAGNNGRPKGTKNKKTEQWEALGEAIISKHAERFDFELEALQGKEFINAYAQILEYFKPKLQRSDVDHTTQGEKINIISLGSGKKPE